MDAKGTPVGIRGFVAEKIVYSTVTDRYMSLKALAAYSGMSVSRLHELINLPPGEALPVGTQPRQGGAGTWVRTTWAS